jgi:hypothetical protein
VSQTVFLLSPASCAGRRAQILLRDEARFDLALRLASRAGATLGEAFSFLSGLYFRGKLAYASAFSTASDASPWVITTNRGLVPAAARVRTRDLRRMAVGAIDQDEPSYRRPLLRDARRVARELGPGGRAVLLGSIATGKYVDVLLEVFGERLMFPAEFVGRGDMSRGGLMLRCVDERRELTYVPIEGAVRTGVRPAKLTPRRRASVTNDLSKPSRIAAAVQR